MAQSTANRIEGVPGRFWHRMDDGRLQCDLCPRFCRLHDGQRGLLQPVLETLHFSAFHPAWKMQDTPPTPTATLRRARAIARDQGLCYVYTGNVHDFDGSSTWCPGCGEILVGRDWYELANWNLVLEEGRGRCDRCATPVPGVFEATPGHWGSRRQLIDVRH